MDTPLLLMLTTLPHFAAAWISARRGHQDYAMIVCLSTLASVAWHGMGSPAEGLLWRLDHSLAGLWGLLDLFYVPSSIGVNALIAMLNPIMTNAGWQGMWHLMSAFKAIIVAGALPYQNYVF